MSEKLKEAASLYNKGDKPQALKILAELVNQEPNNLDAWYGLALCLDDHDKKVYCLKRVLNLDPMHKKAQQSLEKLLVKEKSPTYTRTAEHQSLPATKKKAAFSWQTISLLGIGGAALICVIIVGVSLAGMAFYNPAPTLIPPTHTPTAKLYNKEASTYLERISLMDMPDNFQIDFSQDSHGTISNDTHTTQIGTFAMRMFVNPLPTENEINGVVYAINVFNDVEEAKIDYQSRLKDFSSSKPLVGEFDNGVYEIGIYDKDTHLIYIDKLIRKSNVVISIYSMTILGEDANSVEIVAWSLYYENLIISRIQ